MFVGKLKDWRNCAQLLQTGDGGAWQWPTHTVPYCWAILIHSVDADVTEHNCCRRVMEEHGSGLHTQCHTAGWYWFTVLTLMWLNTTAADGWWRSMVVAYTHSAILLGDTDSQCQHWCDWTWLLQKCNRRAWCMGRISHASADRVKARPRGFDCWILWRCQRCG